MRERQTEKRSGPAALLYEIDRLPAFFDQAVFLQAAGWPVGNRHFDKACGNGRLLVEFSEMLLVMQAKFQLYFAAAHLAFNHFQHFLNFGG